MPVYNGEKYLRDAIDSVLGQTFKNFEFLIINDGSTDNTENIIRSYNDERIKLINRVNGGVSSALNTGLESASGKYVARVDADDICYPTRFMEQYEFMIANPQYVLIGSDAEYINLHGDFIFNYSCNGHTNEEIEKRIYDRNPFIHSVVFFLKKEILECGGYDPDAHTFEDHLLWIKVLKKGKVCNFPKPLVKVRLNPESVTTDERVRGKRFLELRKNILLSNKPISKEDERELSNIIKNQNSIKIKKYGYHMFVSKKYLWNNYQPKLAQEHLIKAIKLKPVDYYSYALLFISFLPKRVISSLYSFIK